MLTKKENNTKNNSQQTFKKLIENKNLSKS